MSSAGLSFGRVNGHAVFMDADEDSYFLLAEEEELDALHDCSVIEARCTLAAKSIFDDRSKRRTPSIGDIIVVGALVHRARAKLKRSPIAKLLGNLEAPLPREPESEQASLLGQRFASARAALPLPANCLADSIALISWLSADRLSCTLVFGVKLDPFAAHCWVQSGDLLLNNRLEEIERFTPVKVIECAPRTP